MVISYITIMLYNCIELEKMSYMRLYQELRFNIFVLCIYVNIKREK